MQTLIRFIVGGAVVSCFALLADVLRPKGFAGLFAAAPSVAVATLGLAIATKGSQFAALEARSMLVGAVALLVYSGFCVYGLGVRRWKTAPTTLGALGIWALVAGAGYWVCFRHGS